MGRGSVLDSLKSVSWEQLCHRRTEQPQTVPSTHTASVTFKSFAFSTGCIHLLYSFLAYSDSSVGTVTSPHAGRSGVRFLAGARNNELAVRPTGSKTARGVKLTTPPSRAKVKKKWSYTPPSPVCVRNGHRGNLTLSAFKDIQLLFVYTAAWSD